MAKFKRGRKGFAVFGSIYVINVRLCLHTSSSDSLADKVTHNIWSPSVIRDGGGFQQPNEVEGTAVKTLDFNQIGSKTKGRIKVQQAGVRKRRSPAPALPPLPSPRPPSLPPCLSPRSGILATFLRDLLRIWRDWSYTWLDRHCATLINPPPRRTASVWKLKERRREPDSCRCTV